MQNEYDSEKNIILFIDDEKNCHTLIDLIIPNFTKYKVIHAYNTEEGTNFARRHVNNICLVLSDIMFPDVNGYEMYKVFKKDEKLKHIPFIFQSGFSFQESELKKYLASTDIYINDPIPIIYKPYKQADLLGIISKVLDR